MTGKNGNKVCVASASMRGAMISLGLITEDTPWLTKAKYRDIEGKNVFGVLPLHLGAAANRIIVLDVLRGHRDMSSEQILNNVTSVSAYELSRTRVMPEEIGAVLDETG